MIRRRHRVRRRPCERGVLARAYPASTFIGNDIYEPAIERARAEAADAGLENATFELRDAADLTVDGPFDAVMGFDTIHDQVDPSAVLAAVHHALVPSGSYLMVEARASSRLEDNIGNPLAPLLYATSTLHCLTVSLARPSTPASVWEPGPMRRLPGDEDLGRAAANLAAHLPDPLVPLARVAYNYRWSWAPGGPATFAAIDPDRWVRCGENPVRLLAEAPKSVLGRGAADADIVRQAARLAALCELDRARPWRAGPGSPKHPIAFLCAEYGVHVSLPVYSGGLGCSGGRYLQAGVRPGYTSGGGRGDVPLGLFPSAAGHERLPARVLARHRPRPVALRAGDRSGRRTRHGDSPGQRRGLLAQVWRVDIGRVPLYLLDADVAANSQVGRWVTSRLYEGNRAIRLAHTPSWGSAGHAPCAPWGSSRLSTTSTRATRRSACSIWSPRRWLPAEPLTRPRRGCGAGSCSRPILRCRPATRPTGATRCSACSGRVGDLVGDREWFLAQGRVRLEDPSERSGMTVAAIRAARSTNGVSRRHGEVARQMWRDLAEPGQESPITHVTNGVHLPTWVAPPMRALLDDHLGAGWETGDPRPGRQWVTSPTSRSGRHVASSGRGWWR